MTALDALVSALAWVGQFSDPLAWAVVGTFLAGALIERRDRETARYVAVGAWVVLSAYWLTVVHYFAVQQKSVVEGVAVVVAIPACLSAAVLLWRGRDSLFVLSRSVAVMGVIYLPFGVVGALRQPLIEAVTAQTAFLMSVLGYEPTVVSGMTIDGLQIAGKHHPYDSTFVFYHQGQPLTYTIRIACTGIGSMAIFGGLIAAVRAPLDRKLRAFAASIPVIYGLNLVRNVFIGLGFGTQRFQVFPDLVGSLFAVDDPTMVSYYVADRIIAQSLSVVVLVAITWLVVRQLPELLGVVEDGIYVVTRREYDLRSSVGVPEVRADGQGPQE